MFEIVPAIDLMDGKCVRLKQGDFAQATKYSDDPIEIARLFEAAGLNRLHVVDLDGARQGSPAQIDVLERLASKTSLAIDYGGGVRTSDDIDRVINAGAAMVTVGSVAVTNKLRLQEWILAYGPDKIFLGADVRGEFVSINGWQTDTPVKLTELIGDVAEMGIRDIFVTDIDRDGMLLGMSTELYQYLAAEFPTVKLFASGGVSSVGDLRKLEKIGCAGAIVGKAFYEGLISIEELSAYAG